MVGVTGFCMGGSLTWEVAMRDHRVAAAVPFYGMADLRGQTFTAPVIAHYGTADRYPPDLLDEVRERIKAFDPANEVYRYEGAPHAFMNDTEASYREDAAAMAWQRTIDFLRGRLAPT